MVPINTGSASLEDKLAQFHEFFTIKHSLSVNLKPLGSEFVVPDKHALVESMPYAFKIAAQMSEIETKALRPLRNLGEHAQELVDFLNLQSKKIDLMMSFILQQQDEDDYRFSTTEFGGGGLTLVSTKPVNVGETAEVKVFLAEEAAGIFCYGEIIQCKELQTGYAVSLIFVRIRDEDQELLVRASLHLQTLQLRARNNKSPDSTPSQEND